MVADEIPEAEQLVYAELIDASEHRSRRLEVGVQVGNDCVPDITILKWAQPKINACGRRLFV